MLLPLRVRLPLAAAAEAAVVVVLFFSHAQAHPAGLNSRSSSTSFPPWQAPGPGDVRSPCPGLNSLANHGILPHSGRGLTLPILTTALQEGLNVAADFSLAIGGAGLLSNPNQPLLALQQPYFDLDMLDEHNFPIEHDASLSRQDAYFGDNHSFNETIWSSVLAFISSDSPFTIATAGPARYSRVRDSAARNPTFTYTPLQFTLSYGETALYLSTMGDPVTGVAPYSFVRSLFEQERLPYELGWRPPVVPTTLASLGAMVAQLQVATGEPLPEGLVLTESTLKLAFEGVNPVTGLLGSLRL